MILVIVVSVTQPNLWVIKVIYQKNSATSETFRVSSFGDDVRNNYLDNVLVDSDATAHITCDKNKFTHFDKKFDDKAHTIELADGTRTTGAVIGREMLK